MRIVSLVPSATETLYALGLEDEVVGITYACPDPEPGRRAVVVRSKIDPDSMTEAEIDAAVRSFSERGENPYEVDLRLIEQLKPDLIVVQRLCNVCAVTPDALGDRLHAIARVVEVGPERLEDVLKEYLRLGEVTGRLREARELVERVELRLQNVRELVSGLRRRRTLFLEWVDPPFCSGHWVPDMIEVAGGVDFGDPGRPSKRIRGEDAAASGPEVIVVGPCGFRLERSYRDALQLLESGWVRSTPAFSTGTIYAVDAKARFSGHGPSIVEGVEALAEMIHPEAVRDLAPEGSYRRLPRS
ncbi:MAG: ABC transporter substrate-binding protein [Nitrososphaerota archaeon]